VLLVPRENEISPTFDDNASLTLLDCPFRLAAPAAILDDGTTFFFRQTLVMPVVDELYVSASSLVSTLDALVKAPWHLGFLDAHLNLDRHILECFGQNSLAPISVEIYRTTLTIAHLRASSSKAGQLIDDEVFSSLPPVGSIFGRLNFHEYYCTVATIVFLAHSSADGENVLTHRSKNSTDIRPSPEIAKCSCRARS